MVAGKPTRIKQDISTYLSTADNLKSQGQPLKSAYTGVVGNLAKESEKSGQGALAKQAEVAQKTDKDTLASNIAQVDSSNWKVNPVTMQTTSTDTSDVAGYSTGVENAASSALSQVGEQAASAKTTATGAIDAAKAATENTFQGIQQYLSEGIGRNIDSAGNIVGSNVSIGKMAPTSGFESSALNTTETLAGGQGATSNIDALRAMLGLSYDPRLAGLTSQVYQGDIAQARGEAGATMTDRERAEAFRTGSLEQYLGELASGTTRLGEAQEASDKSYGDQQTAAEKQIAESAAAARAGVESQAGAARANVSTVQNNANIETVKKDEKRGEELVKSQVPQLTAGINKFFSERPHLRGKYTAERMADELLAGANYGGGHLRGLVGNLKDIDAAIAGTPVQGYKPKTIRDQLIAILQPLAAKWSTPGEKNKAPDKGINADNPTTKTTTTPRSSGFARVRESDFDTAVM